MRFELEKIYAALFDLVAGKEVGGKLVGGVADFKTKSRFLLHWSEVDPTLQPAFYMSQGNMLARSDRTGIPTVWTLQAKLYFYFYSDTGDDQPPAVAMNPVMDKVIALFGPPKADLPEQTLGGLVQKCRIDGMVETDEGLLGPQGVIAVPITILIP